MRASASEWALIIAIVLAAIACAMLILAPTFGTTFQ